MLPLQIRALILWLALVSGVVNATSGQPGTLDSTFGSGGKVITPAGSGTYSANAVAVQADGKTLIVGGCSGALLFAFCAFRYNLDGTPDTSFGTAGKARTSVSSVSSVANAVAIQSDGKIVLAGNCAGSSNDEFCALRYNADGTLDTAFGTSGTVVTPMGTGTDIANAVALQPDGKIVLAGSCAGASDTDFCALRYQTNGTLDSTFGTNGIVITSLGQKDVARAISMQSDGKIVLAGNCTLMNGFANWFCALRYNANGTLDAGFVTGFISDYSMATSNVGDPVSVDLQPDGKLVVAYYCSQSTNPAGFCVQRIHSNGTVDSTFGTSGKVVALVGTGSAIATAIALQPDGKVLVAGYCTASNPPDFCALRLHSDGALDANFGTVGKVNTPIGTLDDKVRSMAVQTDGKIVLAGNCTNASGDDFCAARYDGGPFGYRNCSMDIDGDGRVTGTIDSLIHARIALGLTGNSVINGITFSTTARRTTWATIRTYLVAHCGMSLPQ